MKEKLGRRVLILTGVIIIVILALYSFKITVGNRILRSINTELENKVEQLSREKSELNSSIQDMEKINTELNLKITNLVVDHKAVTQENSDLQIQLKETNSSEDSYNSEIQNLRDQARNLKYENEAALERYSKADEILVLDNSMIYLNQKEDDIKDLFGEPLKEEIIINDGSGIWYLEGLNEKEVSYDFCNITYRNVDGNNNFTIVYIETEDSRVQTIFDIGCGSSVEDLVSAYPQIIGDKEKMTDGTYAVVPSEFSVRLYFEVLSGYVVNIHMRPEYP